MPGFLVLRKLIPVDAMETWRQRFVDICSGRVERSPLTLVMRDVSMKVRAVNSVCARAPAQPTGVAGRSREG